MTGERRNVWFPLAVLGFVLLGLATWLVDDDYGWFAYRPSPDGALTAVQHSYGGLGSNYAVAIDTTGPVLRGARWDDLAVLWLVAVSVTSVASVVFYAVRAHRAGRAIGWRKLTGIVLAGAVVLALSVPLMGFGASWGMTMATAVGLPLLVLGLCAAGWGYFENARGHRAALVIGAVCLSLAVLVLAAAVTVPVPAVLVVLALAVFAWRWRDLVLAVLAVIFLGAVLVFSGEVLGALVPAAVLLAGAIAVLLTARRPTAQPG
ncbi:hypothetical protein FPZ12_039380 [Amycolatopsis acidicola]|uniref:Uncharacterized protein n=1 Tax=Amycolatopsis acidicola TaxID=2596893 RepID=A0A5N0UQI9_9PSEU|nr:hypothetical protein [Amycolatopsis acidicola]KAA9151203.1 hypothetical protein FPZ12_039380 [Amycolatopsis acidicola]